VGYTSRRYWHNGAGSDVYAFNSSMRARPGHAGEVVALLTGGATALGKMGCRSYVVGIALGEPNVVCVHEVWDSKEAHDESLQAPEVRDAIARAMPMLTGEFQTHDFEVIGGFGL
jgi:quinol monooxygenase YgiN